MRGFVRPESWRFAQVEGRLEVIISHTADATHQPFWDWENQGGNMPPV